MNKMYKIILSILFPTILSNITINYRRHFSDSKE